MKKADGIGQLFTTAVDEVARDDPQRTFVELLEPPHVDQDMVVLTFADFANAVNRMAWWLRNKASELGLEKFDTVTYVGLPDIRYYIILFAAAKSQLTILFSAPPNDTTGHLSLMQQTNSKALFLTEEAPLPDLCKACGIPSLSIPSAAALLDKTKVDKFPYEKSYEEAEKDPVVYFHTSGTTGNPKAMLWTQAVLSMASFSRHMAPLDGRPLHPRFYFSSDGKRERRVFISLSAFHASMLIFVEQALFTDSTCTITPLHLPHPSYTPQAMIKWIRRSRCETLITFPSRIEPAVRDDEYAAELKKLTYICTGGAAVSQSLASKLNGEATLCPVYVATEVPFLQPHKADSDAWDYVCLDSKALGIEWRPYADDKQELVFVRDDSLKLPPQCIFKVLPNKQEHSMGDLFTPHPSKPHHWRFAGRVDDIIILSISQNLNPIPFEEQVAKHAKVKTITMLGNGRPTPCLILELHDLKDAEAQLDEIWPSMEKAWEGALDYNRVDRSRVIIAAPEKPVPKSMKGGVKRKQLQSLYEEEIEAVY